MSDKDAPLEDDASYAGRWVARVQGRIVGQGGTPEAARLAAQGSRPKEKAVISYMHPISSPKLSPLVDRVASVAEGQDLYLVGGSIRDLLLGRISHDFDLVVPKNAIGLARRVASSLGADFYVLDEAFDAARVIVTDEAGGRDVLDFTSFRGSDITADLEARDFTINAIALNLHDRTTLDPLQGARDVHAKTLRACLPKAVQDDPIRILRAVRLAAALGFKIEPRTKASLKEAVNLLPGTSAERQRDELFKILDGRRPDVAIRALEMLGVFPYVLPELTALKGIEQPAPHVHDVWEHTLSVMHYLGEILDLLLDGKLEEANGILASFLTLGIGRFRTQFGAHFANSLNQDRSLRALLQFAALYHDVGKTSTMSVDAEGRLHFFGHEQRGAQAAALRARQLGLSNDEIERLALIIQHHLRFFFLAARKETDGELPSRRATYRYFRDTGEAGADLVLMGLADLRGTRGHALTEQSWSAWVDVGRAVLESLWEHPSESVTPPRLVDGHDLMRELLLKPGPAVGELLEAIREGQAAGEIDTRDEALQFGRQWMMKQDR